MALNPVEATAECGQLKVAGIILAGGASSRMGGHDKTLLRLGDELLVERAIRRLASQVCTVAVNSNSGTSELPAFNVPVIADRWPERRGPLAGVLAGMIWARAQGCSHIVTVAGDTPFFPENLVSELVSTMTRTVASLVLAASGDGKDMRRHPTFGIWDCRLASDLARSLEDGQRKIVAWSDRHSTEVARFRTDGVDPFFNVNTPEQLRLARQLLLELEL